MYKRIVGVLCTLLSVSIYSAAYDIHAIPINIVVPAYNEEHRIGAMLATYCQYFRDFNIRFTVVLNGITDNTESVVRQYQDQYPDRITVVTSDKGKGRAIKKGFQVALQGFSGREFSLIGRPEDYIGFVDADGAIAPDQYEKLLRTVLDNQHYDGVIASRYMEGSDIGKPRPLINEWGKKLFYEPNIRKTLGIAYHDYQCGAKLFKRTVIEQIAPFLVESGWAIDLEILYLCHIGGFAIKEVPIRWRDAPGSHVEITYDLIKKMLTAASRIKKEHALTIRVQD